MPSFNCSSRGWGQESVDESIELGLILKSNKHIL